jgi:hypothetical protein
MILEVGKVGIKQIAWFDEDMLNRGGYDLTANNGAFQNLVVFHGMRIDGPVTIHHNIKTFDKSYSPNGSVSIIQLGQYAIFVDTMENANKLFTIVVAIISCSTAYGDIDMAIKAATDLFVF